MHISVGIDKLLSLSFLVCFFVKFSLEQCLIAWFLAPVAATCFVQVERQTEYFPVIVAFTSKVPEKQASVLKHQRNLYLNTWLSRSNESQSIWGSSNDKQTDTRRSSLDVQKTQLKNESESEVGPYCLNESQQNERQTMENHSLKEIVPYRSNGIQLPYSSAIQALRVYHAMHGDLVIPRRFVIPYPEANNYSSYPTEWHGIDLSSSVYSMEWWLKHIKQRPDRVAELNNLGFVWGRLQPEWNIILEALVAYYNVYGNVMVAQSFVVPHGDRQWPMACWGIPLGKVVFRIRSRFDYFRGPQAVDRRKQLDGLGFVWDVQEYKFQIFYQGLRLYAQIYKLGVYSPNERRRPLRVPCSFVVPSNDERWPINLWNYSLGAKCVAVRHSGLYVKDNVGRQEILEDLGFHWGGNAMFGWLEVVHASAIYSKLNNRHLDVPYHFVVPSPPSANNLYEEDWPWPIHLAGLPLGKRLKDVRVKQTYLKGKDKLSRRRQLDALGFVWVPQRGRKSKQKNSEDINESLNELKG